MKTTLSLFAFIALSAQGTFASPQSVQIENAAGRFIEAGAINFSTLGETINLNCRVDANRSGFAPEVTRQLELVLKKQADGLYVHKENRKNRSSYHTYQSFVVKGGELQATSLYISSSIAGNSATESTTIQLGKPRLRQLSEKTLVGISIGENLVGQPKVIATYVCDIK